jgi:hypothetical protein
MILYLYKNVFKKEVHTKYVLFRCDLYVIFKVKIPITPLLKSPPILTWVQTKSQNCFFCSLKGLF